MKQVIFGVLVVAAILGAAIVFGKDENTASGEPSNNFYGQEEAAVTLIEYGDFECPACSAFHPLVDQIKEEYKSQVKFEFRHFPLVKTHFNAQAAHRAAQAAANQGKFWEMHDLLYERQDGWRADVQTGGAGGAVASNNSPGPIFEGYAEELGLDLEQFKEDVAASETLGTINADIDRGNTDGITSTPTFILNGKKVEKPSQVDTVEKFRALIDAELEKSNGSSDETNTEEAPESSESEDTDSDNSEPTENE